MVYKLKENDTILILGGSGLIGSAFSRVFSERNFKNVLTPTSSEVDLFDLQSLHQYLSDNPVDIVINAAGRVGGILENAQKPYEFISKNLQISLNVALAVNKAKCKRVVLFGSSCMYPKDASQPLSVLDLFNGEIEKTSLGYAVSKFALISLGLCFNQEFDSSKFLCVIPNSVYGPRDNFDPQSSHVLSGLMRKMHDAKTNGQSEVVLWGSGRPRREFVFSDDVAGAVIFLLERGTQTRDYPLNIGTGTDFEIIELAEKIKKVVGYNGRISWDKDKPDGTQQKLLDSSTINKMGWNASIELVRGLEITYDWFLKNIEALQNAK